MSKNKNFNFLNFFYGIGAVIILVAAMFKFLGLPYADYIFIVGIAVEAFVFLVSALDLSTETASYSWERVFPQLKEDGTEHYPMTESLGEVSQQQQVQQIVETISTLNASVSELNNATQKLTKSVEMMEKNYEVVSDSTKQYQSQIDSLSSKISNANKRLKDFDNFNFDKDK